MQINILTKTLILILAIFVLIIDNSKKIVLKKVLYIKYLI